MANKIELHFGRQTYVMGIINVTPDSFSGDGLLTQKDAVRTAVEQANRFIESGASILDIGGESTRPGSTIVTAQEESDRVMPVIEAVNSLHKEVLLSIDTYKASVAKSALELGADWVNDVWGMQADEEMPGVVAAAGVPVVLMHNRSQAEKVILKRRVGGQYEGIHYQDLLMDVKTDLLLLVENALRSGIKREKIILDPGIGFGKTVSQNLELVNHLDEIKALGYPILLGPSRKSFIGATLDLPPEERLEGTAAVCAVGIARGADIIRVHDVEAMVRVAKMTDALVRTHK